MEYSLHLLRIGHFQRRLPILILQKLIRLILQQHFYNIAKIQPHRCMQSRPLRTHLINIRPRTLQQYLNDVQSPFRGGKLERSPAIGRPEVGVGVVGQKKGEDLRLLVEGGHVDRCPPVLGEVVEQAGAFVVVGLGEQGGSIG